MQLPHNVGKNPKRAFTIVELITVVVIVSLLITAAIPGYENFVRNNESFILASRLESSLRLAQGEAIRQGIPVTVCPISGSFNPTAAFNQSVQQWPCQSVTAWNAWKVFADPNFNATEDFTNGWPIIQYVGDVQSGSITSNISGPITFDPMGFANINPSVTRAGWTWSDSFSSGEWAWGYTYGSAYTGSYSARVFTITPSGCTGQNARELDITQNGVITISNISC